MVCEALKTANGLYIGVTLGVGILILIWFAMNYLSWWTISLIGLAILVPAIMLVLEVFVFGSDDEIIRRRTNKKKF